MDACASPLGNKTQNQKLFGGHDASQAKDVISTLPKDILVLILSFLSTKEAVKTSMLSKRWKYLWVSMPNFYFSDFSLPCVKTHSHNQRLELRASFLDSIDRALFLRDGSCLESFDLLFSMHMHVDASQLHSWVSAAVKHKVQRLSLVLSDRGEFVLPTSLFTSKSLSHFLLHIHCTLKVPSYIHFSGLKHFHLYGVVFQDNESTQQLFSGFPVLESLTLFDCHWENIQEITIEIPTLRELTFEDGLFRDYLFNGKIIISALNLEILYVDSSLPVELFPCNLLSLNSAKIDIDNWNGGQEHSLRVVKLLSGLCNVTSLHVSVSTLELLLSADLEGCLPAFHNLTSLHNFVGCPLIQDDYICGALVYILQNSPNLDTLDLPRGFKPQEQNMMLEVVPQCFQSSFKSFTLFNVDGNEEDICLLKHVLENAPFLQRLVMHCSLYLSENLEKQEEIHQQLQRLQGGSESCMIKFIPYYKCYDPRTSTCLKHLRKTNLNSIPLIGR